VLQSPQTRGAPRAPHRFAADAMDPSDPLAAWLGRTEERHDTVTPTPIAALAATLDRDDPPPRPGSPLPPLWHWLYFLPLQRQSEIGPDGHPRRGGFLPPVTLPRRMWAGGRLSFLRPLRVGDAMTRTSRVASIASKQARSGPLVFVTVEHTIATAAGVALREEHDIVYRDLPAPGTSTIPAPAPSDERFARQIVPDDVLLFRYSALTFNGHRIHYDRRYASEAEGYPGLIVHGPLIATLLVDLLRRERPEATLARFDFKALSPLFDLDAFSVCGRPDGERRFALWARSAEGALAMQASAEIE
jgi:3-methylfumaryl-CoA hydratase